MSAEDTGLSTFLLCTGLALRGVTLLVVVQEGVACGRPLDRAERLRRLTRAARDLGRAEQLLPGARAEAAAALQRDEPDAEGQLVELEHAARSMGAVAPIVARLRERLE